MYPSNLTPWKKPATDDPSARSRSYIPQVSHAFQKKLVIKNYIPVYSNHLISLLDTFQLHLLSTQILW